MFWQDASALMGGGSGGGASPPSAEPSIDLQVSRNLATTSMPRL